MSQRSLFEAFGAPDPPADSRKAAVVRETGVERVPIRPGACFQGRRILQHRGSWYVSPDEEPRPGGEGTGSIQSGMGARGFRDPRLLWQSSIPMAGGGKRKPFVMRPVAAYNAKDGSPLSEAQQRKAAGPNPIRAGSGSGARFYKRRTIAVGGRKVPDRGGAVQQLPGGPVWWRSRARLKDGSEPRAIALPPLTDEQTPG